MIVSTIVMDSNAQEFYGGISGGYGFSMASQALSSNFTGSPTDKTYRLVKGSYGKGINFGANVGYMITKNIGTEIAFSYLSGSKYQSTYTKELAYTNKIIQSGKMIRLIPALRISAGEGKLKPYIRMGVVIGFGGKIIINKTEEYLSPVSRTESTWQYSGGISFGFTSALGINYHFKEKIALFGELSFIGQTWAPTKGIMKKYTVDGVDQLSSLTVSQKEINLVNSYSESSLTPANSSEATNQLKQFSPFSSAGLNVGIQFFFGNNKSAEK